MYNQAEKTLQELNEMVPDNPGNMLLLTKCLLYNGNYSKGLKILDQWLLDDPMNTEALLMKGQFYLQMKDFKAAEEVINRTILILPEEADKLSLLLDHIEYIQNSKNSKSLLESYAGNYRREFGENIFSYSLDNDLLYFAAENQSGWFGYPVSDTLIVTVISQDDNNVLVTQSIFRDKNGNVAGTVVRQSNASYIPMRAWREYPLIIKAKKLFSDGKLTEALDTFLLARDQYPDHYYLSYYIQHLEYIQDKKNEELESLFKSYADKYKDSYLYIEDRKFFFGTPEGRIWELLPLTDSTFMLPSIYYIQCQMLSEDGRITGLKFFYRNNIYEEEYYPRNLDLQSNLTPNQ
jgi:tetratricopeptide (TPR) repeat protein